MSMLAKPDQVACGRLRDSVVSHLDARREVLRSLLDRVRLKAGDPAAPVSDMEFLIVLKTLRIDSDVRQDKLAAYERPGTPGPFD